MKQKIVIILIILAMVVVILIQNRGDVEYRLFFWSMKISKMIFLPLAILVGFALGFLVARLKKK